MACPMCGARWTELGERLGCEVDPELDGRFLPIFEAIVEWLELEYPGDGEVMEAPEDGETHIEFTPDPVRLVPT